MARYVKLQSGKWQVHVCVNRIRKTRSFRTKAQAQEWARDFEIRQSTPEAASSTPYTLGGVLERYATEVSESKKGARWEIVRIKKLLRDPLASIKLDKLRREDFEGFIQRSLKTVKAASVNRELNLVSHALTQARRWRLMNGNPMADLKRPKAAPPRDRRITAEEIEKLLLVLNYAEGCHLAQPRQRVAIAFLFALETGMRAGEICALEAENVSGKVAHLADTKNGLPRNVPLSPRAREIVDQVLRLGLSPLFGLRSGSLSTIFRKAVAAADIKDITFHDSRHEAITRLAKKLEVLDLARMVGHSDIRQLQTYYNESAADIAEKL